MSVKHLSLLICVRAVPISTHVHGQNDVPDYSDGYPEVRCGVGVLLRDGEGLPCRAVSGSWARQKCLHLSFVEVPSLAAAHASIGWRLE
jgi:hypothetical protein